MKWTKEERTSLKLMSTLSRQINRDLVTLRKKGHVKGKDVGHLKGLCKDILMELNTTMVSNILAREWSQR
jgi:hypothetical protein